MAVRAEGAGGSATEGAGVRETREEAAEEAEAARAGAAAGGEGEEATGPHRWGVRCWGEVAGWGRRGELGLRLHG